MTSASDPEQPAHHGVGQEPAAQGEHDPAVADAPTGPSTSPSATRPATAVRPAGVEHVDRQPLAQAHAEQHPSSCRCSAVRVSRPAAGECTVGQPRGIRRSGA